MTLKLLPNQLVIDKLCLKIVKKKVCPVEKNDSSLVLSDGANGKWTPHDMRRTGATNMQKLKIEARVIDRCQNHVTDSGNKIRKVYQLYDFADEKKEAWEKWGARLEEILSTGG